MRIFRAMIIFRLLALKVVSANENNDTRKIIPDMLRILCPRSNVCRTNASNFASRKYSCCTECSCNETCESDGNCCFPEDHFDIHNKTKTFQNEVKECLFLSSKQPTLSYKRAQTLSVWMISSEKEPSVNTTESCGEVKVAPWGSLLPVSSKTSGKIFKNHVCASAYNVSDGVTWSSAIGCSLFDTFQFIFSLETDNFPDTCQVQFASPKDIQLKPNDFCYMEIVDTCDTRFDYFVPSGLPMSKELVAESCTSGLFSPYRSASVYANVFCHICSGNSISKYHKCTFNSGTFFRDGSLSALIDDRYIQTIMKGTRQVLNEEKACMPDMPDRCKPLLCPLGQLRDTSGRCASPITSWISVRLILAVKLETDRLFLVNDYIANISTLTWPVPKQWVIESIFYRRHNETQTKNETNTLLVFFRHSSSRVKHPDRERIKVNEMMKQAWHLRHSNDTILKVKISFWEFRFELPVLTNTWDIRTTSENYRPFYSTPGRWTKHDKVFFTKLFLCGMVELDEEEFYLTEIRLFNRINNRTLGDSEFSKVFHGGKSHARICAEDSGFTEIHKLSPRSASHKMDVTLAVIIGYTLNLSLEISRKCRLSD